MGDAKMFAWDGDPGSVEAWRTAGFRPVVLSSTDMIPSLQTGMIDMVPAAPVFALAGQFDRPAPYMLKINWAPIVGAMVMTAATWDAMSPQGRAALTKASAEAGALLRSHRDTRDDEIIRAMEQRGLKVISPTPEAERAWREFAQRLWPRVRGNTVPAEMFDRVEGLLAEYRGAKQ
jgi:TRAP-type C4-dicarboxylate transport system substrate-binding protein